MGLVLKLRHHSYSLGLDGGIIAESVQPVHARLAPEPGHLALGVVAMRLLRRQHRQPMVNLAADKLHGLLVSSELRGGCGSALFNLYRRGFSVSPSPELGAAPA